MNSNKINIESTLKHLIETKYLTAKRKQSFRFSAQKKAEEKNQNDGGKSKGKVGASLFKMKNEEEIPEYI